MTGLVSALTTLVFLSVLVPIAVVHLVQLFKDGAS